MKTTRILAMWILLCGLFVALPLQAQPRQGRGGGPGGMMRTPRVEQILAFLAFDEKMKVSDGQFVGLRSVLKDAYTKQQEMGQEMRQAWQDSEGDREAMREKMMSRREVIGQANQEMKEKIGEVLDEKQVARLEKHLEELQERGGGFGGRGGFGRGGGRGRGESDQD